MYLQDIESQKSKNSESKLRAAASRGLRNALYRMKGELSKALLLNVIQGWRQGSDATRRAADIAAREDARAALFIAKGRAVTRVKLHVCVAKKPTRLYGHFS